MIVQSFHDLLDEPSCTFSRGVRGPGEAHAEALLARAGFGSNGSHAVAERGIEAVNVNEYVAAWVTRQQRHGLRAFFSEKRYNISLSLLRLETNTPHDLGTTE